MRLTTLRLGQSPTETMEQTPIYVRIVGKPSYSLELQENNSID